MHVLEAVILGVVQGLTEFLPISSSAHLTLLPAMAGWSSPLLRSLTFDVALHFGTLAAVVAYFGRDLVRVAGAWVRALWVGRPWDSPDARLGWLLIAGTLPAVAAGLAFGDWVETLFRDPVWVAWWLILFGLLMGAAERLAVHRRHLADMTLADSLWIGLAQALALMPGVSRSGSTITAGLFLRFSREEAARFAFLLAVPAILGAVVHQASSLRGLLVSDALGLLLVGTFSSAVAGYACIAWLLAYLKRHSLYVFMVYRLALGAAVLLWIWFRGR